MTISSVLSGHSGDRGSHPLPESKGSGTLPAVGEALRSVQEQLDAKNFYAFNPSFDCPCEASCQKCGQQNQNR